MCVLKSSGDGAYGYRLGDPALLGILGEESPVWHSVSMDLIGPFILRQFDKARGKGSTYKVFGLTCTDLASGVTEVITMDGATSKHVMRGILMLCNRYRTPKKIIVDAGPQLKSLENNPLLEAVTASKISLHPVCAGHQFLNWTERQIGVLKKLMFSLNGDKDRSMFDQGDTLISLQSKLLVCFKVMNMRTVLTKGCNNDDSITTASQIMQPMLTRQTVSILMNDLLHGKEHVRNVLDSAMLEYSSSMTENFHHLLLSYLQDCAVFYADHRASGSNKQQVSNLDPLKGDFVTFRNSAGHLKFGVVEQTGHGSNKGVVTLRAIKNGQPIEQMVHSRTLRLVYRSSETKSPVNN